MNRQPVRDIGGVAIGAMTGSALIDTPTSAVFGALFGFALAVGLGPVALWPINRLIRADFRQYR